MDQYVYIYGYMSQFIDLLCTTEICKILWQSQGNIFESVEK